MTYVKMDSADVLALVNPIIEHIESTRAEMLESLVDSIIASREWWRRFLPFLKPLSREAARSIADRGGDSFIPDHQIYAWGVLGHALELRTAAQSAKEVIVKASDLHYLRRQR